MKEITEEMGNGSKEKKKKEKEKEEKKEGLKIHLPYRLIFSRNMDSMDG